MVSCVGTGFFYNRFNENRTLQTHRFNGVNLLQTSVVEPIDRDTPPSVAEQQLPNVAGVYSMLNQWSPTSVPSVAGIPATQQTIWQVDPNLQIPTVWAVGTQVERQLPRNITMFVGFYNIRIVHVIRARDVNAPLPRTITELTPNGIRPDPARGEIYRYEASGQFNQRQFFIGFNSRFSRTFQLNGNYSLSKSTNDTDGQGGQLFPMNSYDLTSEFGRSSFDIRHRFTMFGTINLPLWKVVLNPFVIAGFFSFRKREHPMSVPVVPIVATKCVIRPVPSRIGVIISSSSNRRPSFVLFVRRPRKTWPAEMTGTMRSRAPCSSPGAF